jgi:hypothetical protein
MQLDAVHQNVVRYKLLMERYRKHLRDHSTEAASADGTTSLEIMSIHCSTLTMSRSPGQPGRRLRCRQPVPDGNGGGEEAAGFASKAGRVFDVFAPGRRLLHESELFKQTRKELQPRYLVLFSVSFWHLE